jgi:hypothetical protein
MVLEDSIEVRRGSTYEQVGEDRGSKETDRCPLTASIKIGWIQLCLFLLVMALDEKTCSQGTEEA